MNLRRFRIERTRFSAPLQRFRTPPNIAHHPPPRGGGGRGGGPTSGVSELSARDFSASFKAFRTSSLDTAHRPAPQPPPLGGEGESKIYPTGFSACDTRPVLMREAVVDTKSVVIGTRFERDAIEGGDIQDRCFGEKKGSRRSLRTMVFCNAREPGTHARR